MIEWIPFDRLINIQKVRDDETNPIFSAIWLDGMRIIERIGRCTQTRKPSCLVELKALTSQANLLDLLNKFKDHLQSEDRVYGLNQTTKSNEYMLVFDEFRAKRKHWHGTCVYCNRYNTSEAWRQTCDPLRMIEGWASGNKIIDNFIKKYQLEATENETMIEWIPFNRLDNIQTIGQEVFSAT